MAAGQVLYPLGCDCSSPLLTLANNMPNLHGARHVLHLCAVQVNASTVELVDLETYVNEVVQGKPMVLWNLELDTLRADLGEVHNQTWRASLFDLCTSDYECARSQGHSTCL
jgi:hypothetical protein